jgi:hypothetical protein
LSEIRNIQIVFPVGVVFTASKPVKFFLSSKKRFEHLCADGIFFTVSLIAVAIFMSLPVCAISQCIYNFDSGGPCTFTQNTSVDACPPSVPQTEAINEFYAFGGSNEEVLYCGGNTYGANAPEKITMQCAPPAGATIQAAFLDVVEYDGSGVNPPPCTTAVNLGGAATPPGVMSGSGNLWNIFIDPRYGDPIAPADYPSQTAFNIRYNVTALVSLLTTTYSITYPNICAGMTPWSASLVIVYTIPDPGVCGAVALDDGLFYWDTGEGTLREGVTPFAPTVDWSCADPTTFCTTNQFSVFGGSQYGMSGVIDTGVHSETGDDPFTDNFYGTTTPTGATVPLSNPAAAEWLDCKTYGTCGQPTAFDQTYNGVPMSGINKITWGLGYADLAYKQEYWVNLLAAGCNGDCTTPTNTPTSSPTNTPTNTPTVTPTPTNTNTPTSTDTSTPTHTPTNTSTNTNTNTVTNTPTDTVTNTPTVTNTATPTNTPTVTNTNTPTNTDTVTNTNTPTNSPTNTGVNTPTNTATVTNTNTPTNTSTITYTDTPTNTDTVTGTNTPSNTATATDTFTPTDTATNTYTPTNTDTVTSTNTTTYTATVTTTFTPTATATDTPTVTHTNTPTYTATVTDTNTETNTATSTYSPTNTYTATLTSTYTPTHTATNTVTTTATHTATSTATHTATNTNTSTATLTPTVTATSTATLTPTTGVAMAKNSSETTAQAGSTFTYSIGITVTGNNVNNMVVTDLLPSGLTFVAFGNLPTGTTTTANPPNLQWNLPSPLATGTYQLTYQVKVGNSTAGVILTNNAQLTYTGLGKPLTSSVNVQVPGEYTVNIDIYNSAGEVVKVIPVYSEPQPINNITLSTSNLITTLQGPGSTIEIYYNGTLIGTWDGSNNSGNPVTNGNYSIVVDSVSPKGVVTSVQQDATVNRKLSDITANIYNSAGEIIRTLYFMVGDANASEMTSVNLSANIMTLGSKKGADLLQIVVYTNEGTPVTLTWDGTNNSATEVVPGTYMIQLHWDNGQGETTNITRSVIVVGGGASGTMIAEPNVLTNGETLTTFNGTGIANAWTLTAKVYTIAGEIVKSIPGISGTAVVQWNASGVASGVYIVAIQAQDFNGGVLENQLLKVLVLH